MSMQGPIKVCDSYCSRSRHNPQNAMPPMIKKKKKCVPDTNVLCGAMPCFKSSALPIETFPLAEKRDNQKGMDPFRISVLGGPNLW